MFGKNEKTELKEKIDEQIPENNIRVKESSGGKYALNAKDELVFRKTINKKIFDPVLRTWVKQKPIVEEIPINEMHWFKEILDSQVVMKKVPSRTEIDGVDTLLFLQTIQYRVRHEYKYTYLHREEHSRKIFLKDFNTSISYQAPHNTNTYVFVEVTETRPVTKEEVMKLHNEGKISDIYSEMINYNGERLFKKQVYAK